MARLKQGLAGWVVAVVLRTGGSHLVYISRLGSEETCFLDDEERLLHSGGVLGGASGLSGPGLLGMIRSGLWRDASGTEL